MKSDKMDKGKLIEFEGIDASGKATQAKMLSAFLQENNIENTVTDEPVYSSPTGMLIKEVLHSKTEHDNYALQLLFTVDRAMHVHQVISPALESGRYVIADRYLFSTIAYSMASRMEERKLDAIIRANMNFPQPLITFVLDVDPNESAERMALRSKDQDREMDKFENNLKFMESVRNAYLELSRNTANIIVIDGNRSVDEVSSNVTSIVAEKLGLRNGNKP